MTPSVTLSLTGVQHETLQRHLLVPDGCEAAAIVLCGQRADTQRHRLLVQEIHLIPYELCSVRTPQRLTWPTDYLVPLLEKAERHQLSVVKLHSHPGGYEAFSKADDDGDSLLLTSVRGWVEHDIPHGSVVMLPGGKMFGRILWKGDNWIPLKSISVAGADIKFWHHEDERYVSKAFTASHTQAFGQGTTAQLARLTIGVIGCSGTGSPVIEQLVRLGVGELVIVDDDHIEDRNINRILNSTIADATEERSKVEVLKEAIEHIGLGTHVTALKVNLWTQEAVKAIAGCDVVFGCMDTVSGRFLLNTLTTFYIIPYFDLGVRLDAVPSGADRGRIREVCGTVHYLQPGRSSLMSRGLVEMDHVVAERIQQISPELHAQQVQEGYIRGVTEQRPAVISVNMLLASLAVNDFLARLHPYREEPNSEVASIEVSLSSLEIFLEPEAEDCNHLQGKVGLGDVTPLLRTVGLE